MFNSFVLTGRIVLFKFAPWTALLLYLIAIVLFPPFFVGVDGIISSLALGWGEPNLHAFCQSYGLSYPLYYLSCLGLPIDVFTLYVFALNGLSVFAYAYALIRTDGKPAFIHCLSWLVLIYIVVWHLLSIEFGVCSLMTMASGLILLVKGTRVSSKRICITAILLMFAGALLRFDSCVAIIPFAIILIAVEYWYHNRQFWKWGLAAIAGVMVVHLVQEPLSNTQLWGNPHANLVQVNKSRAAFCDYPDQSSLAYQEEKIQRYAEAGLSPSGLALMAGGHSYLAPHRDSGDFWNKIKEIRQDKDGGVAGNIKRGQEAAWKLRIGEHRHLWQWLVFVAILLCFYRGNWVRVGIVLAFVVLSFYLIYAGRYNFVASRSIFLASLVCMLLCCREPLFIWRWHRALSLVVLGALAMLLAYRLENKGPVFSDYSPTVQILDELNQLHEQSPEIRYVVFTQQWRWLKGCDNFFWKKDITSYPYLLCYGDWISCLPFYEARLQQEGISSERTLHTYSFVRFLVIDHNEYNIDKAWQEETLQQRIDYLNEQDGTNWHLELEYSSSKNGFDIYRCVQLPQS